MEYNNQVKNYRIIIGLGNPDPLLAKTYHNVGALALGALVRRAEEGGKELRFKPYKDLFEYASAGTMAFVKPLVFMNDSGRAVRAAAAMFEARPLDITVMHDDSDIAIGSVKFSRGQNAAGHRGVQSIIDALKSKNFERVRIGIRSKTEKRRKKASEFVLKPIKISDKKILAEVFDVISLNLRGEGH